MPTNLTDRLGELVDKVTPGPYEAKRAAKPDNTGGFDWAIIATDKAIIAECFEHVDWREEGVSYETSPAQANAEYTALCFTHKHEILSALRKAERLEKLAHFGAVMFDHLFERFCDGDYEVEVNDLITVDALKADLVAKVPYDPEQHSDESGECEPGDDYYQITQAGRHALQIARLSLGDEK